MDGKLKWNEMLYENDITLIWFYKVSNQAITPRMSPLLRGTSYITCFVKVHKKTHHNFTSLGSRTVGDFPTFTNKNIERHKAYTIECCFQSQVLRK